MPESQVRQNFAVECEAGINKQIGMELGASYAYMALAAYYDRDDVAYAHAAKFFRDASHEEREHAEKLIDYQNKRGGRVVLREIAAPDISQVKTLEQGMQVALQYEKDVNKSLLDLHDVAEKQGDSQFMDFLESEYLAEQVEAIKQLGDYVTQLKRVGDGLGSYLFDKMTLKDAGGHGSK